MALCRPELDMTCLPDGKLGQKGGEERLPRRDKVRLSHPHGPTHVQLSLQGAGVSLQHAEALVCSR